MAERKNKPVPQPERETATPPHGDTLEEAERSTRRGAQRESVEQDLGHSSRNTDDETAHLGEESHE